LLLATRLGLIAAGLYLLSGAVGTLVALLANKNLAGKVADPRPASEPSR
jgi:hypothetical protein